MSYRKPLLVHLNANSVNNKAEEVRQLISGAGVVSLQDHRLRDLNTLRSLFPGFNVYGHTHDTSGPGSVLLISTKLRHRAVWSSTTGRHRCTAAIVTFPSLGGVEVNVASYYAPPNPPAPALDPGLLDRCFEAAHRAVVLGDLNARHQALGCTDSNTNGVALRNYLEERPHVPLNDSNQATFFHTGYDHSDTID